jgi:2-haloalkanoic acid dehalogenase type II
VSEAKHTEPRFRAVAFDLLTALIDSWSLWIDVANDDALGRSWRRSSLRRVTTAGSYRSYETIVVEAAVEVGLTPSHADQLLTRWAAGELHPWPEAPAVLSKLAAAGWRTAVVTNCSQRLAEAAAAATGHNFDAIVSAEKAKVYKTDPGAYRAGLAALGNPNPADVLFVAGSAHDVPGAGAVGMPVYWSNRFGEPVPLDAPPPVRNESDLSQLPTLLVAGPMVTILNSR